MFLVLTLLMYTPSYTALVVWDYERALLRRESNTGTYKRLSFYLAKTFVTTPFEVLLISLFSVLFYFMVGLQASATKFFIFWLTLQLFTLCSETIGVVVAIVTPDSKTGVGALTVLMVLMLSFSGYLVRRIPVYFAWIGKVSYFSFASDILVVNEFEGLRFTLPPDEAAMVPAHMAAASNNTVDATLFIPPAMRTGLSLPGNMGVLFGITAGLRLLGWLLLEVMARLKKL